MCRIGVLLFAVCLLASTTRGSIGLGEAFCGADLSGVTGNAPSLARGVALIIQATENLQRRVVERNFEAIHGEDALLALAFSALRKETNAALHLRTFVEHLGAFRMLTDTESLSGVDAAMTRVAGALKALLAILPASDVAEGWRIAGLRSCPTHNEQTGERGEQCFRCGTRLSRPVPAARPLAGAQTVVAELVRPVHLTNGIMQTHRLRLALLNHAQLVPGRLIRVHGQKLHVFLLDASLSDYHHVHPRPSLNPGEYEFEFTPRKPGGYRLWIELHVAPFGFRQYARLDLPGSEPAEDKDKLREETAAELHNAKFDLVLPASGLHPGVVSQVTLRISESDGKPLQTLEPLMEAFAHLVGFGSDYKSILHTHPLMPPVTDANARGGPELQFQVLPTDEGILRFFAQVKIAGEMHIIPFSAEVRKPAPELTARAPGKIRD